jgi:hypothetical protein
VAILSKGTPTRYDFKKWRFLLGGFFALSTYFTLIPVTENRNRYILVVGDYFTKLTEACAIPYIQAISVADISFRAWIKRYGCPLEVHSDQGKQYERFFQRALQLHTISKSGVSY